MNSFIIPQGPTEILRGPATINREILVGTAITECVCTDIVHTFPAAPANAAVINDITLGVHGRLLNVKTVTLTTGDMWVIYRH